MGAAGLEGCPASWLGVQSSHAERAVARRSVGPGADLIGLTSSPPPMLHLRVRALFIFLFLSVSSLLSPFKQLKLFFALLKPWKVVFRCVYAFLCVGRRGFFYAS